MSSIPESTEKVTIEKKLFNEPPKDVSPAALRELLEKNLKWAQIIYEQNRRINTKLVWAAVAGWLRLFLILIPLILGVLFLPEVIKTVRSKYSFLFAPLPSPVSTPSVDDFLKTLHLDAAQKEQLKTLIK
jgi:hypothetical protein